MTKTTKICLNKEDRNEEFNNTTEIFKRNGYPRKIFEIARKTTPNLISTIPYVKGSSEKIRRYNIRTSFMTKNTIRGNLNKGKT